MRILTAADVRAALPMEDAIEAMRAGFAALSTGRASVPVRSSLTTPDGLLLYMPAYIEGDPISVVKIVSVYGDNPAKNLPTVNAMVMALDAETGVPIAMMDGTMLTAIRTGAGAGLATRYLARADAAVLAVIGAGAQARTQIEAVCAVRPIREIRVYSPTRAAALVEELRASAQYDAEIVLAPDAHAALDGADVISTATNSPTPVVAAADVSPGVHINGVGSFTPHMAEVGVDLVMQAKIVVDHRLSAWAEAGDLIQARDAGSLREEDIYAELGEIAAEIRPGRERPDEITFFKSVGNAVQDAAAALMVLRNAGEYRLGTLVTM